jgi:hypothetical protein
MSTSAASHTCNACCLRHSDGHCIDPFPDLVVPFVEPLETWDATSPAPCFYDWRKTYPFLETLRCSHKDILDELSSATRWFDWPETSLYSPEAGHSWKVYPFLHTFPAWDASKSTWIQESMMACPKTASLLRKIPGIRTALFSRMGPNTHLTTHCGWADLANHVLRCHLALKVPAESDNTCGLVVDEAISYHKTGELIVFDDSKAHSAFNNHPTDWRYVLIFDVERPKGLPLGLATGSTTDELQSFIDYFK